MKKLKLILASLLMAALPIVAMEQEEVDTEEISDAEYIHSVTILTPMIINGDKHVNPKFIPMVRPFGLFMQDQREHFTKKTFETLINDQKGSFIVCVVVGKNPGICNHYEGVSLLRYLFKDPLLPLDISDENASSNCQNILDPICKEPIDRVELYSLVKAGKGQQLLCIGTINDFTKMQDIDIWKNLLANEYAYKELVIAQYSSLPTLSDKLKCLFLKAQAFSTKDLCAFLTIVMKWYKKELVQSTDNIINNKVDLLDAKTNKKIQEINRATNMMSVIIPTTLVEMRMDFVEAFIDAFGEDLNKFSFSDECPNILFSLIKTMSTIIQNIENKNNLAEYARFWKSVVELILSHNLDKNMENTQKETAAQMAVRLQLHKVPECANIINLIWPGKLWEILD